MSTPPFSAFPQTASWNADLFGGPGVTVGSDILYPAMRLIRLIRPGHGPQPEIITEALAALNALIDSWGTERLIVPAVLRNVFTLTASQQSYSIGPSGDFMVASRPSKVERAGLIDINANPSLPSELPLDVLTLAQWRAISIKAQTSTHPRELWYDQSLTVGNGTLYLWPIPTVVNQVALYLWQTLLQFQAVEDAFAMQPGYLRALQYNLAVELAPRFENAVLSPLTLQIATEAKGKIKSLNRPPLELSCDSALTGSLRYDWRTGEYR
jgi:hypothetical protein